MAPCNRITAVAVILLAGSSLPSAPVLAGARPQIVVRFEVESGTIKDGLRARESDFEDTIARHLAAQIGAKYAFLAWNATEDPAAPVLGRVAARMADAGGGEMPPIVVQWFAQRSTEPEQLLPVLPIEIYKRNDPIVDATDPEGLQDRTLERLDAVVPTEAFLDNLFENFISRVPLAASVTPIAAERVLELPLQRDDLPIGQKSVMDVEFSKTTAAGLNQGLIELTRFVPTESGRLRGGVDKAQVNAQPLPLVENWHPELLTLLEGTVVQCFLIEYVPDKTIPSVILVPQ